MVIDIVESIWQALFENLAATALLISVWAHFHPRLEKRLCLSRSVLFGAWMGGTAIISIMLSVEIEPGVHMDFRNAAVSMSGLFGGPISALVTALLVFIYRVHMGGAGTVFGTAGIFATALLSAGAYHLWGDRPLTAIRVLIYAGVISVSSLLLVLSPISPISAADLHATIIPITAMSFLTEAVAGLSILKIRDYAEERDLLRAALAQSPDYHYVKDAKLGFKFVNQAVAVHNGYREPEQMIGLTDMDIADAARGNRLVTEERQLLATGIAIHNKEEQVETLGGLRWFSTSKVRLSDESGRVIGLAGVTHDITERKRLEVELTNSKDLLARAMSEMSDGLAMFDSNGHLVFCNAQYLGCFPLTAHVRVPGAHIRAILKTAIERGEFVSVPRGGEQAWIEARAAALFVNNDQDVKTADGRWLSIRTRIARDSSSLVVVTDVTALKESELSLKDLTVRLKAIAETDGLTGIANRRAFDFALQAAIRDAFSTSRPLSLILIDIDQFKAYNDENGHNAGDHCLQIFGECLKQVKTRDRDMVARYGGEEFAVILPDTDLTGAIAVGNRMRELLHQRAEPHSASERGILTASMGVTTWLTGGRIIEPVDLLDQADKALYQAKLSGRDCLKVWTDRTSEGIRTHAA